jgi:signal transduction histidine kinase
LRPAFDGKIVIIGSLTERKKTPIPWRGVRAKSPLVDQSAERTMSGIEIHANILNTLLQQRFIRPFPNWLTWLVLFALTCLTAAAFAFRTTAQAVGVAVAEALTLDLVARLLLAQDLWLYTVIPTGGVAASAVLSALLTLARARLEVKRLATEIDARDAVTATVVHDLKQPLVAISALAAVLGAHQDNGRVDKIAPELIARIQEQIDLALADVDEMLTVNRHREIVLDRSEFDIVALTRALAIAQSARSPAHQIEVVAPQSPIRINGDQRYLGRAINNLLENAIKYWPEGGTVFVRIYRTATSVCVEVQDGGIGIAPQDLERIFEPHQRAVSTTGCSIDGTGIGLFSAKRIIEAHGGTISVRSKPGAGSTFTFQLPVAPEGDKPTETR